MEKINIPEVTLKACEKSMPIIGLGTSSSPPVDLETEKTAILEAIKAGYRHFDTAFAYGSEQQLGAAIAEALSQGLIKSRDELFITTKLFASFADRHLVVPAINMSLRNLQLDYIDMYLIHWPFKLNKEVKSMPVEKDCIQLIDLKSVWEGMEECKNLGLTKGIGVSNFPPRLLDELLSIAKIPPAVNQVEMSTSWQQKELREYCKAKGIHITAYSPLGASGTKWGGDNVIGSDVLVEIAKAKGKSVAQIALRWVYEQGVSMVAKSYNKERMRQNIDIFDWSLTEEELSKINQIPQHKMVKFASFLGPHDVVLEIDAEL